RSCERVVADSGKSLVGLPTGSSLAAHHGFIHPNLKQLIWKETAERSNAAMAWRMSPASRSGQLGSSWTTVVYVSFQCASACLSEDRVASLTGVWSSAYSVLRKGALAPCLIAVLAISSSSVDTRTRLKHPLCSA